MNINRTGRLALAPIALAAALVFGAAPAYADSISAKALGPGSYDCDSSEWHFVITQVESQAKAPASISVAYSNGASETLSLDKFTGGTAHYVSKANLSGATVVSASADIYAGWSGQFNLSHGPCPTNPGENIPFAPGFAYPAVAAAAFGAAYATRRLRGQRA